MIQIGSRITLYNFFEKGVEFWWGLIHIGRYRFLCFRFPTITGRSNNNKRWYIYLSPNATPWACTWFIGSDKNEKIRARIRRLNFGLAYNPSDPDTYERLYTLNHKFHWFRIDEYDISQFGTHTMKEE